GGREDERACRGLLTSPTHLHRPQRATHRRPPHPLHLAAKGARRRYRAQSGDADCRDGTTDQSRDPHRRYAGVAPAAAEPHPVTTPWSRRQRQRRYPPDILLTTPEQLALLLSSDDAPFLFSSLKRIVLDEWHALVTSKRGDLLSLGLARLWRLAPGMRGIGLSATVAEPESLARFLVPQRDRRSE